MNEKVKNFGEKVKKSWSGLTSKIRLLIIGGVSALLIVAIVLTVMLNRSDGWIVLFPDMTSEEATEVYLVLQNQEVETQINKDGEIEVREEEWDSLVYELAELGYPQSTPSYGIFFDNLSMTMTEFEKEQTLRFQLQDRLEQTLRRIDGISGAVVEISFPEKSNYVWQETESDTATASVTLTLKDPDSFTAENVTAVKNLVAYSAQQMEPENVNVTDTTSGETLLSAEEVTAQEETSTLLDVEARINYNNIVKNQYEINAEKILVPIYGNDGVTAVAAVNVDYDKITEEVRELITNENGEGVKENEHIAYNVNGVVDDGGIVGEEDNTDIPNYTNAETQLTSEEATAYERDTEWAIGYILTQTEKAQGVISDASIAVVVTTEGGYLSNEERDSVIQLVKNATNIDAEKISVSSRASVKDEIQAITDPVAQSGSWKKMLKYLIPIAAFLLLLVIILLILISRKNKKRLAEQQQQSEETINELQQEIEENKRQSLEEAAKIHGDQEKAMANEVREFAKNNPEITAQLIRSLMKEDE